MPARNQADYGPEPDEYQGKDPALDYPPEPADYQSVAQALSEKLGNYPEIREAITERSRSLAYAPEPNADAAPDAETLRPLAAEQWEPAIAAFHNGNPPSPPSMMNICASMTAPDRRVSDTYGATVQSAPALDGIYYGGAGSDAYYLRDVTTGSMIELSGNTFTLVTSQRPLSLETDTKRLEFITPETPSDDAPSNE